MPTYQPGIPTGAIQLDQDYLNLQGNFQQLNIAYGLDHVPFSDTSGLTPTPNGISGMHKQLHMIPISTIASHPPKNQPINGYVATSGIGQLLSAQINDDINTDEALFWLTGGNRLIQLTRNFVPSVTLTPSTNPGDITANGATMLPGGLILNYGSAVLQPRGTLTPITFKQPFTLTGSTPNVYSVTFGLTDSSSDSTRPNTNNIYIEDGSLTQLGFNLENTSSSNLITVYWMAIGK
jgi:hypothetical protein